VGTQNKQSKHALSAVRSHVHLLLATVIILSLFMIVYQYWHDYQRHQLEEAANRYHWDPSCILFRSGTN